MYPQGSITLVLKHFQNMENIKSLYIKGGKLYCDSFNLAQSTLRKCLYSNAATGRLGNKILSMGCET